MGYTIDEMNKMAYRNCMKENRLDVEVPLCAKNEMDELFKKIEIEAMELRLEGVPEPEYRPQEAGGPIEISCTELSKLTNLEFVNQCYRLILGREPDMPGKTDWLVRLNSGMTSKIEMIYDMANSMEGRQRNIVVVDGRKKIKIRRLYRKLCKLPILGKIINLCCKSLRIYKTIWNMQYQISMEELRREYMSLVIDSKNWQLAHLEEKTAAMEQAFLLERYELSKECKRLKKTLEEKEKQIVTMDTCLNGLVRSVDEVSERLKKDNAYECIEYFEFENHFRGDRGRIKEMQKRYLPYYKDAKSVVLDLGCGRGEFLENLQENGIQAVGIEAYSKFADYDKELGLNVVEGDAIEYLRNCDKVGGIFAGQLIEHLKLSEIIEICNLAYEKLEKDAYIIMETPNPTSLVIFTESFYIDPSHNKPVHPQTIKYLLEKAGFTQIEFVFTVESRMPFRIPVKERTAENEAYNQAIERANEMLFGSQDYAVVARR